MMRASSSATLTSAHPIHLPLLPSAKVTLEQKDKITRSFYLRNLLPIGASMAATLAAGNAVYLYLPVGFIQMLKAFTPVVTLVLLMLCGVEWPVSRRCNGVLPGCNAGNVRVAREPPV